MAIKEGMSEIFLIDLGFQKNKILIQFEKVDYF